MRDHLIDANGVRWERLGDDETTQHGDRFTTCIDEQITTTAYAFAQNAGHVESFHYLVDKPMLYLKDHQGSCFNVWRNRDTGPQEINDYGGLRKIIA